MARRSYQQHCGLAAALDVVAQRWALLIVRDLAPGPRRFTDLFDGLPGISTDMLAQRLRQLEAAGAVERVELQDPAPAVLYRLTERGRDLVGIATDLAHWGAPLLPDPHERTDRLNPRWALQTIASRYRGGLPDGDIHLTIRAANGRDGDGSTVRTVDLSRDEALTLRLSGTRASLRYGHSDEDPLLALSCGAADFFALRLDSGPPEDWAARAEVRVVGDLTVLVRLFDLVAPGSARPMVGEVPTR